MSVTETFGARYRQLTRVDERLALEHAEDRRAEFAEVDRVIDAIVVSALRGERVVQVTKPWRRGDLDEVALLLDEASRPTLAEHFSFEHHQTRGAWYLPARATLDVGTVHLAHWMNANERFALTLADAEDAKASLAEADAVALWSALVPLFDELCLPLKLRSITRTSVKTPTEQRKYWKGRVEPIYRAFGFADAEVAQFGVATGWGTLNAEGVTARRSALVAAWSRADLEAAARLRTHRIGLLVDQYYAKAKRGSARRRQVVTKAYEPILSGYFGGDWLAFLSYLGEQPHPGEQLISTLPETELMLASGNRVATAAAGQTTSASAVEQRVRALERLWGEFDALHARQEPGMLSLYGLMAYERPPSIHVGPDYYRPGREEQVLSGDLVTELKRLWGTKPSTNPERLLSERCWGWAAASAYGPAFTFWHGVTVTTWLMCRAMEAHSSFGAPLAGKSLAAMTEFNRESTDALAALGCPVDAALLDDLYAAEARLGPRQETWHEEGDDFVSFRVLTGAHRDGFEILRDIVTRHRRAWTERYPDYLERRWKAQLRAVGEEYFRYVADKEKAPTARKFRDIGSEAAACWFGGDLTGVYGVLGLQSPIGPPTYARVLPGDWRAFVIRVFAILGGRPLADGGADHDPELVTRNNRLDMLAGESLKWVELYELHGRAPTLEEFGQRGFAHNATVLADDVETAWQRYANALQEALVDAGSGPV